MAVEADQGYLVVAVNRPGIDYIGMATRLAQSIRVWHPQAKICLLTDQEHNCENFDFIKLLPLGDQGGYQNDWQAWLASPFRETIKLEADMIVASSIDHWWTMLRHKDVAVSVGARDYYDNPVTTRFYRRVFDENHLLDLYNAITYWRISKLAKEFWDLVRSIFNNWTQYKTLLKFPPVEPDTDLVYAMVAMIIGTNRVTLPFSSYPRIVHMKQHAIPCHGQDWTQELVWESGDQYLRVNTVSQWACFHYYKKNWNPHA